MLDFMRALSIVAPGAMVLLAAGIDLCGDKALREDSALLKVMAGLLIASLGFLLCAISGVGGPEPARVVLPFILGILGAGYLLLQANVYGWKL